MEKSATAGTGGFLATLPMSIIMLYGLQRLPFILSKTPPPHQVTEEFIKKDSPLVSAISHFLFGAAASIPYAKAKEYLPKSKVAGGAIYGAAVWAINYGILLKLFKSRTSAYNMSRQKNLTMIASHLVWGIAMAYTEDALHRWKERKRLAMH